MRQTIQFSSIKIICILLLTTHIVCFSPNAALQKSGCRFGSLIKKQNRKNPFEELDSNRTCHLGTELEQSYCKPLQSVVKEYVQTVLCSKDVDDEQIDVIRVPG